MATEIDVLEAAKAAEAGELPPTSKSSKASVEFNWNDDPENPYNWPKWRKNMQLAAVAICAFTGSVGSSIVSPAHQNIIDYFGVSSTVAFLPLTTYVLALGLGPVVGGPLSETAGRKTVYLLAAILGGLFSLGAGFTKSFAGFCILRFLAGFAFGPSLSIGSGFLAEVYIPAERGRPAALFTLTPFLGPGFGPVIGVFLVDRKGWQWTQFTITFFACFSLLWILAGKESYHSIIQRRRKQELGLPTPDSPSVITMLHQLLTTGVNRPLHMLVTEPIVGGLALYVAFIFGVLYIFFSAFFPVFQKVYGFTMEQAGLVFLAIVVGCVIGVINVDLCTRFFYRPQISRFPPHQVPPEYRLLPAMIGSIVLPIGLFLFAWSVRRSVSPAVPILAVVFFGAGNISLFIGALQYNGDVYHRSNIASATAANSLARYTLSAVFPLFSLQLYQNLGAAWASSLLGFVSLILLPMPWLLFKFGRAIRLKSKYKTASY
ncbi:MFS general substrate transporter [Xylaria sp. CBS 124048]|nr:MFS general substrate transporter [Xylaria sp. CBS 124048]